jgi:hypothetical protein
MAGVSELIKNRLSRVDSIVGKTAIINDDYQGVVERSLGNYFRAFTGLGSKFVAKENASGTKHKVKGSDIFP